ncbi:MAG: DUF177 domain-containing protein [Anaerolineaceae bacterium]|nr:DUF177 domain-containing protein [Anaerolineaceae bacterium]
MNQPRFPLRFNVGFLLNASIGTSRDIHFEFPGLKLANDLEMSDFNGMVRVTRTPQGMLVQAEFGGNVDAECVRCLAGFLQPIQSVFSELYAFKTNAVTESGLILPDDSNIDLAPLAREYLLLEIPISPLCKPDCKGLCMVCGEDLNVHICEHAALTGADQTNPGSENGGG